MKSKSRRTESLVGSLPQGHRWEVSWVRKETTLAMIEGCGHSGPEFSAKGDKWYAWYSISKLQCLKGVRSKGKKVKEMVLAIEKKCQ